MSLVVIASILASTLGCVSAQKNPIQVKEAKWIGNVTSTNTQWSRDLGFQGRVGDCWINTFGDDFICRSENPQRDCHFEFITSRNSCGRPKSPHTFEDVFVGSNDAPEQCIPDILFEAASNPAGITNAISIGSNLGIIYFLTGNQTVFADDSNEYTKFAGAGFALMEASADCSSLTPIRIFKNQWFGNRGAPGLLTPVNETFYGDHGALSARDGYIYVFGSIPGYDAVGLARVRHPLAAVLPAYEYWNGHRFQVERIFNPTPEVAVMENLGQGTVFWNEHYQRYIYLTSFVGYIYARTAINPWGPWSSGVNLFTTDDMPYRFIPADGTAELFYSPAIQPKFSDHDGKYITLWTTYSVGKAANDDMGGHQVITAIKVTFA